MVNQLLKSSGFQNKREFNLDILLIGTTFISHIKLVLSFAISHAND